MTKSLLLDIKTEITGNVWKVLLGVGSQVAEGDTILILESMKMEIPINATEKGVVEEILIEEGDTITEGTVVARIKV